MLTVTAIHGAVLKPVSFELADGECLAVRGASGAGKSTLLRAIADLDPNQGDVRLDGRRREDFAAPAWRRQVVYVAAEPGWWADTPLQHFLSAEVAVELSGALGLPPEILSRPISLLSTGERQRLALARALARRPRVVLLDEPTASLDADARAQVEALIERRRAEGLAALWVTHDAEQAARVARRSLTLEAGSASEASA